MWAARPTAWSTHTGFQFRNCFFYANITRLSAFPGRDPANPFIAGKWSDVMPKSFYSPV